MVRTYKRKTNRASTAPDTMLRAVRQVLLFKKTIRGAAEEFGINYRTLARYCSRIPRAEVEGGAELPSISVGFVGARQVFSSLQEAELVSYVLLACEVQHMLPPRTVRRLAFQLAEAQQLQMPPSWRENRQASADWFTAFLKRHPLLSVRTSEPLGLARTATSDNSHGEVFFSKLKALMERHRFRPEDVWVVDELGVSAAQRPDRVVSRKALKRVGCVSSERGSVVSVTCAISAAGHQLPPYFVFPRVHFREHFLSGAPAGSCGGAHLSGWMKEEHFLHFLKHFVQHTERSPQRARLLLLDGPAAQLSIEGLGLMRASGVLGLSLPPHLEDLECCVFGPLKTGIAAAMDQWMLGSPGRSITIHHIPALVASALPHSLTAASVTAGFRACGIVPDIEAAAVTDTPIGSDATCGAPEHSTTLAALTQERLLTPLSV